MLRDKFIVSALLCTLISLPANAQAPKNDLLQGFKSVPQEARMRLFWRIFGPAWKRSEIDAQLTALKAAGVGGVMTSITYPLALDDAKAGLHNQTWLSPEFLETLRYARNKAHDLGLRFGIFGGTGWPYGGPMVSPADSAQRIRMVEVPPDKTGGYTLPKLREGETYFAAFVNEKNVIASLQDNRIPVTEAAPCRLFITGPTFMQVKRPALGGEGLVLDHLSEKALTGYIERVLKPLTEPRREGETFSLFCDSFEVYNTSWTHDFPAQFKTRRGYDIVSQLPVLFGKDSPETQDVRYDYWRTIAELAEERFAKPLYEFTKRNHILLEVEPYGTPPMGLTTAQYCDVPTGEQYEWRGFNFTRYASSGAHLAGKKIIGAEAWTWTGYPSRMSDSLSDLKLCSDLHFLSGANDLTGVDFPYSPKSAGKPGWIPYYGPFMNPNNSQWDCFPALVDYINRCQWILRQGKPVADVALYLPSEDAMANAEPTQLFLNFEARDRLAPGQPKDEFTLAKSLKYHSRTVDAILGAGYNFDGVDCFTFKKMRVLGGELRCGDGAYRILILPNVAGIDLESMEKIALFVHNGGTVIAAKDYGNFATHRLPDRVYGKGKEKETARLRTLVAEVFDGAIHTYGEGEASVGDTFVGIRNTFVPEDMVIDNGSTPKSAPTKPGTENIAFVHRKVGDRDFYFVVNVGETPLRFSASFLQSKGKSLSLWDPRTGKIYPQPTPEFTGRYEVDLSLPARGSVFVCFSSGIPVKAVESNTPIEETVQEIPDWKLSFPNSKIPTQPLSAPLPSWTQIEGGKFYSGTATYKSAIQYKPEKSHKYAFLQCDSLHECAEVFVNDKKAGVIWLPPYRLDIRKYLKAGENKIELRVSNLPVNGYLGQPEPDLKPLRAKFGNRFPAPQEKEAIKEPLLSGIMGGVKLRFVPRLAPGELPN